MKTVFNNDEIPHLWAHKAQSHAQGAGSIGFRDETGYSYAMPICRHIIAEDRARCVLFTTHSSSVTTARHKNQFRMAIPFGLRVYPVDNVLAETKEQHARNVEIADYGLASLAEKLAKARPGTLKASCLAEELKADLGNRNDYAQAFGVRVKPLDATDAQALAVRLAKDAAKARRKADKLAKEHAERKAKDNAEHIAAWLNGEKVYCPRGEFALLRASGEEMETSHGARVPLSHAKRAIKRVVAIRAAGTAWQRNGQTLPVGHYHIDSISAEGDVVAGCHRIAWSEIERFAKLQGWIPATVNA